MLNGVYMKKIYLLFIVGAIFCSLFLAIRHSYAGFEQLADRMAANRANNEAEKIEAETRLIEAKARRRAAEAQLSAIENPVQYKQRYMSDAEYDIFQEILEIQKEFSRIEGVVSNLNSHAIGSEESKEEELALALYATLYYLTSVGHQNEIGTLIQVNLLSYLAHDELMGRDILKKQLVEQANQIKSKLELMAALVPDKAPTSPLSPRHAQAVQVARDMTRAQEMFLARLQDLIKLME